MSLLDRYARFLESHPRWILALILGLTVVTGLGYWRDTPERFAGSKSLDSSSKQIQSSEQLFEEIRDQFDIRRPKLILVMSLADDLDATNVQVMRAAVQEIEQLPQVENALWVDQLPALNVFGLADPLLPPNGAPPEAFTDARQRLRENPLAVGQLVSEDLRLFLVPIRINWLATTSDEDTRDAILTTARNAGRSLQTAADKAHGVQFAVTGDIPLFLDQIQAHRRNQFLFQVIGYGLVLSLAFAIYRNVVPVLLVSSAPVMAIFWSLGLLRWLGEPQNPLSDAVLPVLVAIVGITDGIHLLAHLRHELDDTDNARVAAASAVRQVGIACFLTSLTTAIGFASLMFAEAELVRGFGRACAVGVVMAFVAIVTVLPLLGSTRLARRLPASVDADLIEKGFGRWYQSVEFLLRHRRAVSLLGIALTLLGALSLLSLVPDDKKSYEMPRRSGAFQILQECDRRLGGIELAQVVVEWSDMDTPPADQQILAIVQRLEDELQKEPLFRHPLSIHQLLLGLGESVNSAQPLDRLVLLPSALREAVYRDDLARTLVTVRLQDVGVAAYEPVFARTRKRLAALEQEFPGFSLSLTSESIVRSRKVAQVVRDLQRSLIGAAIIIFSLLALIYRSLRIGLLAIVPNLLPLAATATLLVAIGRNLDVSAACAFTVCLGIAVDDTIHFLSRFMREHRRLGRVDDAIRVTFRRVGTALIVTTAIMVIGFSTVLVSEMPSQQIFGAMAVCTISAALVGDMIFLPALLSWLVPNRPGQDAVATDTPPDQTGSTTPP